MQSTLIITWNDDKNSTDKTHKGRTGGKGAVKNKRAFRNIFLDLWPYFTTSLVADYAYLIRGFSKCLQPCSGIFWTLGPKLCIEADHRM